MPSHRSPTPGPALVILGLGGILFSLGLAWIYGATWWTSIREILPQALLAGLIYSGSHLVRIIRSVTLLGGQSRSVRTIGAAHLVSAIWSGFVPLKLGELVRMYALGRASGSLTRGLAAVWVERTFDAVLLALAAGLAILFIPTASAQVTPILILSLLLLGTTCVAVVALPENLVALKHWTLRRYSHPATLTVLAALDRLLGGVRTLRALITGKVATVGVLTGLIWTLESLALWVMTSRDQQLIVALLAILSDVLQTEQGLHDGLAAAVAGWRAVVFFTLALMAPLGLWRGVQGGSGASLRHRRS